MTPATSVAPTRDDLDEIASATLGGDTQSRFEQVMLGIFIVVPFLALIAAVPIAWGGFLGWRDVVLAVAMYAITGHGITVGFHRYFTHRSFKPNRPLRGGAGRRRVDGDRGSGRPLGRRPPQAPRVLRPRRGPALALALRRERAWP